MRVAGCAFSQSAQSNESLRCLPVEALDPWLPTVPYADSDQTERMFKPAV